jgi:hypothetical protein
VKEVPEVRHQKGVADDAASLFLLRPANQRPCRPCRAHPQPDRPVETAVATLFRIFLQNLQRDHHAAAAPSTTTQPTPLHHHQNCRLENLTRKTIGGYEPGNLR